MMILSRYIALLPLETQDQFGTNYVTCPSPANHCGRSVTGCELLMAFYVVDSKRATRKEHIGRWSCRASCEMNNICHDGTRWMNGGQLGRKRTEETVKTRAYWPGWQKELHNTLRICQLCARYHRGSAPKTTHMKPFVAGEPWETLSLDITGPHWDATPISTWLRKHSDDDGPLHQVGRSNTHQKPYGSNGGTHTV